MAMDIKVITFLHGDGTLVEMYKSGLITPKVFTYLEIYLWVDLQIKTRGITKNQAVLEAEVKFEKGEATIWRALKSFS